MMVTKQGTVKRRASRAKATDEEKKPKTVTLAMLNGEETRGYHRRGEDTRNRILEAAQQEFAQHGIDGATIRSIARRAGVSHTRFVYYFDSKEGLWQAVVHDTTSQLLSVYDSLFAEASRLSETEILKRHFTNYILYAIENPLSVWIMTHLARAGGYEMDWYIKNYLQAAFDRTTELVRAAQAKGTFIAGDPAHLQYLLIGAAIHIVMQRNEAEAVTNLRLADPAFVDQHIKTCLGMFFRDVPVDPAHADGAVPQSVVHDQ